MLAHRPALSVLHLLALASAALAASLAAACSGARVCPEPLGGPGPVLAGDANGDGALDLADGVALHRQFYAGAPAPACPAASELVVPEWFDTADALALWSWQFLGWGPAPSLADGACPDRDSAPEDAAPCGRLRLGWAADEDAVEGPPGGSATFRAGVELRSPDLDVEAWSLSVRSRGCTVAAARLAGTASAESRDGAPGLRDMGFAHVTPLAGAPAVTSATAAVVLSWLERRAVPASSEAATLLALDVSVAVPESGCATCTLVLEDGAVGDGQPVENVLVAGGRSYRPKLPEITVESCAAP